MQSIETKYVGPGYSHGSKIKATASGCKKSVRVSYRPDLTNEENHDRAAMTLAKELKWFEGIEGTFQLVRGGLKNGNVYVILTPSEVVTLADVNSAARKNGIETI